MKVVFVLRLSEYTVRIPTEMMFNLTLFFMYGNGAEKSSLNGYNNIMHKGIKRLIIVLYFLLS